MAKLHAYSSTGSYLHFHGFFSIMGSRFLYHCRGPLDLQFHIFVSKYKVSYTIVLQII